MLVINATPCRHPPGLPAQTVMLAWDERLLATVVWDALHVTAVPLPAGGAGTLRFLHLNHEAARGPGQIRRGQPLGLMLHSLRLFAPDPARPVPELASPAPPAPDLALRFESIGQGCQFGLVQRAYGAEPLGLLRFVDTTTAALYEGLCAAFAGIEDPAGLALHATDATPPTYRWHQAAYGLCFDTGVPVGGMDPQALRRQQARRLAFLRRKFLEDVAEGQKIFVLTRSDCLTQAEALAVFCALTLHGPATLLWTVFGDPALAGQVDRLAPGFLRGHLGAVDEDHYANQDTWRTVMHNAWELVSKGKQALLFRDGTERLMSPSRVRR